MIVCAWKDIKKYASLLPGIEEAFDAVNALTEYEDKKNYPLSNGNRFFIAVQGTKAPDLAEAHRDYLDIQYIVKGEEIIAVAPIQAEKKLVDAKEEKDVWHYECETQPVVLKDGDFMVLYPSDLHLPGKAVNEPSEVLKVVIKVRVD